MFEMRQHESKLHTTNLSGITTIGFIGYLRVLIENDIAFRISSFKYLILRLRLYFYSLRLLQSFLFSPSFFTVLDFQNKKFYYRVIFTTRREFSFKIFPENIVAVVQYFKDFYHASVKLIFQIYFIFYCSFINE